MFKVCPFVNNVPYGHPRAANICNNITCIDVIAALENSSIIYIPTCRVLIMTEFNTIFPLPNWKPHIQLVNLNFRKHCLLFTKLPNSLTMRECWPMHSLKCHDLVKYRTAIVMFKLYYGKLPTLLQSRFKRSHNILRRVNLRPKNTWPQKIDTKGLLTDFGRICHVKWHTNSLPKSDIGKQVIFKKLQCGKRISGDAYFDILMMAVEEDRICVSYSFTMHRVRASISDQTSPKRW